MSKRHMFTVYDVMEQRGDFDKNPANITARDREGNSLYKGPQAYPRMVYHPEGKQELTQRPEIMVTPMGPQYVNEHKKLISKLVQTSAEYAKLKAEGWHDHPADAIAVRAQQTGEDIPLKGAANVVDEQAKRIAELEAQIKGYETPSESTKPAPLTLNT